MSYSLLYFFIKMLYTNIKGDFIMYNVTDLKNIPELPVVYIMYDNIWNILYIGKAKNLKNRIPVYFKEIRLSYKNSTSSLKNIYTNHFLKVLKIL